MNWKYNSMAVRSNDMYSTKERIDLTVDDTEHARANAFFQGTKLRHGDKLYRDILVDNDNILMTTEWYADRQAATEEMTVMRRKNPKEGIVLVQTGTIAETKKDDALKPEWTREQVLNAIAENILAKGKDSVRLDISGVHEYNAEDIEVWAATAGCKVCFNDGPDTILIKRDMEE